jgi:hypothetical protein
MMELEVVETAALVQQGETPVTGMLVQEIHH